MGLSCRALWVSQPKLLSWQLHLLSASPTDLCASADGGKGCGGEALEGRRRYSHAVCWGSASRQAVAGYRPGEKFLNLDPSAGMLNKTMEAAGPHK